MSIFVRRSCVVEQNPEFLDPCVQLSVTVAASCGSITNVWSFLVVDELDYDIIFGTQWTERCQKTNGFDKLAEKASPQAFHLADSDLSHSTCFTNTRTKILERMKGWALSNIEKDKFVMWLHGAAGGGKTAIARTMAKWCEEEGILLGEFFFSRVDGTRAQLSSLAPTLAYRMAVHTLQDAKQVISDVVRHDPHIFLATLAVQLKKLVLEPLELFTPCGITPYVIILDGLDETLSPDDQQLLLNAISETLHALRLRIIVCCRPEPTIVTAFNDPDSSLNVFSTNISLNDDDDADADIRAFLVERFAKIKKQLPHPPSEEWPTPENIEYLVAKSSRQFIFASTVEKYVCSPKHRHQAVARLKYVLNLKLLPHLEDKKKHPFADLDALYDLILRTRNDVDMSVKATAVCLEYQKYFKTVSPANVAKVLHIELSETWAILFELASLFDASEDRISPFHASLGDFLFDRSRSLDLFCIEGDIVADITCALLRPYRDPEGTRHQLFSPLVKLIDTLLVLSYHIFSRLLGEATPRQDLRDILSQMQPSSIFRRPDASKKRSKGAYYLIPLLRQLESHISSDAYKNLVAYFDQQFALFLPSGYWTPEIFHEVKGNKGKMRSAHVKRKRVQAIDSDSDMPALQSISGTDNTDTDDSDIDDSDTDDSDDDSDDGDERIRRRALRGPISASYLVSELTPLSTSPVWDEINAQLNIGLTGPDSLEGYCDEAHFARSRLTKTSSALLNKLAQAKAALFCLEQMKADAKAPRVAFAKLLPHSLSHAERLPKLTTEIQDFSIRYPNLYKSLHQTTKEAITEYLNPPVSTSGSKKRKTAAGVVPNVSPAPPVTVQKSSTKATTSQKPSTTTTSSTARRTTQKLSPSQPPSTTDSKYQTPSQPRPVPRTFRVPSHSTQTQPSPSTSQKASTASRAPLKAPTTSPITGLKSPTPSRPQPAPRTRHSSAPTQLSPDAAQQPRTVSRTPEQRDSSQPPSNPDPNSSTPQFTSTTSGPTLEPYPSESLTSAQAPSDSTQAHQGPSRRRKNRKGPRK